MPKNLERCVKKVKAKKGIKSAYGICKAALKRKKKRAKKR